MAPTPRPVPRILVVDDDATQRILVREALEDAGFDIAEAENGTEGIAKTRDLSPDLVILDVIMPDLDGFAVCEALRREPATRHIPILMATGLEDEASIERAFEVGATNFVAKPINWAVLHHHVRYLLRAGANERELLSAKLEAEAASRAKTQILANMSHELRTPLNAIIGFAELTANQALGPLNNLGYVDYAKDIKTAGDHLLDMVNDLLDLSKVEFGEAELLEDTVDLGEVVRSCVRIMRCRAEETGLTMAQSLPEPLPWVRADERKLRQIILNLLSNAIKFTPANGRIELAVLVDDGADLLLRIRDSGIGMAADDISQAMQPFRQLDAGFNRNYPGTGLGLPLAKSFIELHGGSLTLQSAPRKGTTVTLRLPAWRLLDADRQAV